MIKNIRRTCIFHIKSNVTYYVSILCAFVCGGIVAAACVLGLSELSLKELSIYFDDFFKSINSSGSDSFNIFKMAVESNLKLYILLILLSVMVIGSPFIVIVSSVLGYSLFFTLFFVFKTYGIRAMVFVFGAMLPHQLILLPCYALTLLTCLHFSVSLFKVKSDMKTVLPPFLIKMTVLFLVSLLSALLEAYVEPIFLELMSPLFLEVS
ncbi:MAG: hypothetical protein E7407_04260 [Ruminococcaceae bacterium]|nr:hypothetical protein [Oscillospiraceae bacterium]